MAAITHYGEWRLEDIEGNDNADLIPLKDTRLSIAITFRDFRQIEIVYM